MLSKVSTRKATSPDNIPGQVMVFTSIFNLSVIQCVVLTCFKSATSFPVPQCSHPASLNNFCPVALTSIVMKCFEKLVKPYIHSSLLNCLDPLQFAYRTIRSADDIIAYTLHTILSHLDQGKGNYSMCRCWLWTAALPSTQLSSQTSEKKKNPPVSRAEQWNLICQWNLDFLISPTRWSRWEITYPPCSPSALELPNFYQ